MMLALCDAHHRGMNKKSGAAAQARTGPADLRWFWRGDIVPMMRAAYRRRGDRK